MGGNVNVNGLQAQKIPVKEIGRNKFKKDFLKLLERLNEIFYNRYDYYLWLPDKLNSSLYFNGSSSFLFSNINNYPLLKLKPNFGDIDIIVPKEAKEDLWNLLKELEGIFITNNIEYIGNNKPTVSSIGEQINALFVYCYKDNKCINVQIDFELEDVQDGIPTVWSKFAHSSSFDDLDINVKSVFHKYLLRSITRVVSSKNAIFVTKSADCDNWKKKIKKKAGNPIEIDHVLKFSLKYGIRIAYEPLICNGKHIQDNGKFIYREIDIKNSKYYTNLEDIFKILFKTEPKNEIELLWSFKGLIELMKKYLSKKHIQEVFKNFLDLLYETKDTKNIAQELDRNKEIDYEIKINAVKYFIKQFPYLKRIFDKYNIDKYYDNFGKRSLLKEVIERVKNGNKLK